MKVLMQEVEEMNDGDIRLIPCESHKAARELALVINDHFEALDYTAQAHLYQDTMLAPEDVVKETRKHIIARFQVIIHKGVPECNEFVQGTTYFAQGAIYEVQTSGGHVYTGVDRYRWYGPSKYYHAVHEIETVEGTIIGFPDKTIVGVRKSFTRSKLVSCIILER